MGLRRFMNVKKVISVALAASMIVSLAACGEKKQSESDSASKEGQTASGETGNSGKDGKYTFYLVDPYVGYPYWDDVWQGCEAAAECYDVNVVRVGPTQVNYDEQLKYMETAIADKCDGIFTSALAPDTFAPVIEKSMEAGIPTFLIDSDAPNTSRIAYCGTSNYDAGYQAGEVMIEAMGGKGTCAILTGTVDAQNCIDRQAGFEDALKDSDIEVVAVEESNNDLTTGVSKASAMFLAYPEIDCAIGLTGSDAIAMATAAEELGYEAGKITILGWDDQEDALSMIRDGKIYGQIAQNTFAMGWDGVMYCYMAKEGLYPTEKQEGEDVIDTGVIVITKDNVDDYKSDMTVQDLVNDKTMTKE